MATTFLSSKRTWIGAALFGMFIGAAAWADEPPHLDFVHGLRERGYPDLALEYLLKIQSQEPPVAAEIKNALPLEIAHCRQDMIAREQNSDKRALLLKDTRADLDAFVKNPANANHPALPEVRVELAILTLDEGRRQVTKSQSAADAMKGALVKDAVRLFDEAAAAFESVGKSVEGQLSKIGDPKDKKGKEDKQRLQSALLNAQLNEGIAQLEKSLIMTGDIKLAGAAQQKAQKVLEELSNQRDQNPIGWIAMAWLFRASIGLENAKVENSYKRIIDEKKPEVVPAQRLVRYFVILELTDKARPDHWRPDPNPKTPFKEQNLRVLCESWLRDFPKDENTPEGQQIRFLLGERYLAELQQVPQAQRQGAGAKELANKAMKIFDGLAATHGEYSREAANLKFSVLFISGEAKNKKIEDLKSFDENYLRARIEYMEASQAWNARGEAAMKANQEQTAVAESADAKEKEEHTKEADKFTKEAEAKSKEYVVRVQDMLKAARRSQAIMPENVKDEEHDTTYELIYEGYRATRDPYRACVICDFLTQNARKPDVAKRYAVLALKFYQSFSAQDPSAAKRLVAIAELMESKWPTDLETDAARDILGRDLMGKKKFREAAVMFEKVSERSPTSASSSYYGGICYWVQHLTTMRETKKPANTPSPERDKAIAMLERAVKKYEEMKDEAEKKKEVQARLYLADEVYNRLGEFDKVLAQLNPLMAMVDKKSLPPDLPPQTDSKILSLTLKAYVQKKDVEGAKKILETLKKRGSDDAAGMSDQLVAVGKQIRAEITKGEALGEAERDKVQELKGSFRQFLAQIEADANLSPEVKSWVGGSYASIGDHSKAITVFASIKDPGDKAPQQAVQTYHSTLLMKAVSQRLLAAAETNAGERRKLFDKADKDLADVMKNTWAKKHPSFQKEQIMLLQDQELYSGPKGAIKMWSKFQEVIIEAMQKNEVQQNTTRLKTFQEHYFDASYNLAYCMYKEAKQIQDKAKSDEAVLKAAERFNLLMNNQNITQDYKSRIEQFVHEHRDLKREYDKLNNKKPAA